MARNELEHMLGEAERLQAILAHLETAADAIRRDRDIAVQRALASGASISEMSRLVGITRQSIMRIRDLNLEQDPFDDQPSLTEELSWHYDGQPYGSDQEDERA